MSNANKFTATAVREIRALYSQDLLDTRAWAQAYGVSLETIRRIARGDTYKVLPGEQQRLGPSTHPTLVGKPANQVILPAQPAGLPFDAEPDREAAAHSWAIFQAKMAAQEVPPHAAANALIDEMIAKVRHPAEPPTGPSELLD